MELSPRQTEIAGLVARGCSDKVIAAKMGIGIYTVREYIKEAARRIPGHSYPKHRLKLWFFGVKDEE